MADFTVSDLPTRKSKYSELLQAAGLNFGRTILVNANDAKKQQLNLLMWLRRNNLKAYYSTSISNGKLFITKLEDY